MKFISKSTNLLIVLRPGLSAQPLTGTPAKPTVSVRFKDGLADVQQEEIVAMMLAHPGFNSDYICADDVIIDPYLATRQSSEPTHVLTEMQYGTPGKRTATAADLNAFPAEIQRIIKTTAAEMAKSMLPSLVESTLKELVKSNEETKKSKGKPGRKPKPKLENKTQDESPATENLPTE
jgi:hypothetical protein